jgi:two-component system KDP operon response regulator KdpE
LRILIIEDDAQEPDIGIVASATLAEAPALADGDNTPELESVMRRLKRLVHRYHNETPDAGPWGGAVRFGEVAVEYASQTIYRGGRQVRATPKEFRLLHALIRREGRIASRPELMEEVWGPASGIGPRVIDTHIARLRRKLEQEPAQPRYIVTALNVGYRFQQ